ncbi:ATP-binding protein [Nocardioides ginsengisoli]|uniref:ATP-binding protein n=1 Tax=Nocardioides ginsengisoli TaxID=363868 RepID=A0ABW3VUG5_9ACTN
MADDAYAFAVPFHPSSVGRARSQLRDWLQPTGAASSLVEDAALVLSELVTNSLQHARPTDTNDVGIEIQFDHANLHVAVTDGGSDDIPRPLSTPLDAAGGRGLTIVGSVAEQWWWEAVDNGQTVHALLRPPTAP